MNLILRSKERLTTWRRNYTMFILKKSLVHSHSKNFSAIYLSLYFMTSSMFTLKLSFNILGSHRRWGTEYGYKFNYRADKRTGCRTQFGRSCNGIITVAKTSDASERVVTSWVWTIDYPYKITGLKISTWWWTPLMSFMQGCYLFVQPSWPNTVRIGLRFRLVFAQVGFFGHDDGRKWPGRATEKEMIWRKSV